MTLPPAHRCGRQRDRPPRGLGRPGLGLVDGLVKICDRRVASQPRTARLAAGWRRRTNLRPGERASRRTRTDDLLRTGQPLLPAELERQGEPPVGFEPTTCCLRDSRSWPAELGRQKRVALGPIRRSERTARIRGPGEVDAREQVRGIASRGATPPKEVGPEGLEAPGREAARGAQHRAPANVESR